MSGGIRKGAGAPKKAPALKKQPISLKLPKWLLDWMDIQPESRAVLIENSLRETHKIAPPTKIIP